MGAALLLKQGSPSFRLIDRYLKIRYTFYSITMKIIEDYICLKSLGEEMKTVEEKNTMPPNAAVKKLIWLSVVLILIFMMSICIGRYSISPFELIKVFFSKLFPVEKTWIDQVEAVVFNIRLPRILLAILVGSCLSLAGVSYQSVFQNPMASPDILGATSGAAFGAALAILFGGSSIVISGLAFGFSLLTVGIVFSIGKKAPGSPVMNLILAGIMIGSLFTAGTSFIKLVADPTNQLPSITYWLMGSFSGAKHYEVIYALVPMMIGTVPLLMLRWRVNLLTLGEEACRSLGVNPDRLRFVVIISSTIITAASVSVSGMIGWVGLVIPHLCRKIIGNDLRYLMPACMLTGAGFMLLVDNISRNLLEVEIPIGILTAVIGAPFFILLIFRGGGIEHD